jgi:hypothetical protein
MPSLNSETCLKQASKSGTFERGPRTIAAANIVESATIAYTLRSMVVEYL